jgi:hypothetical protein
MKEEIPRSMIDAIYAKMCPEESVKFDLETEFKTGNITPRILKDAGVLARALKPFLNRSQFTQVELEALQKIVDNYVTCY